MKFCEYEMWTLKSSLTYLRKIQKVAQQHGYHTALTGSVLLKGKSKKDLDIVLYPHDSSKHSIHSIRDVRRALRTQLGLMCRSRVEETHEFWREMGSKDRKCVEVYYTDHIYARRVDIFYLS